MNIFEWRENMPVTANNLNEMQNILNDNILNANESGSDYIMFPNGTLVCFGKTDTFNVNINSTTSRNITLPKEYENTEYIALCSIIKSGANGATGIVIKSYPTSTEEIRIDVGNYVSQAIAQNMQVAFLTIGKVKEI